MVKEIKANLVVSHVC